jgi:subtilisin family serine protease
MKKRFLLALVIAIAWPARAQRVAENAYWFYFTDKLNNGFSLTQPEAFLSQRSIDRRAWQSLPVDQSDLPVTKSYVDSLEALGLEVMHTSKWLNGVLVASTDNLLLDTLHRLSFIDTLRWVPATAERYFPRKPQVERFDPPLPSPPAYLYGFSANQIKQINLDFLHEKGYTGRGVLLAVLDAGFTNLTTLPAFTGPVENGQILAARNFVEKEKDVYNAHSHGTNVSSIIVAQWPDTLMGTAPDVQLILATTEDARSETRIEEYSWIEGAEWADSLGADIINTSLGYTVFDDTTTNYSYRDMDGQTAHISIANGMTAAKGMISVTSAGNSGSDDWYHVGAPADADDILAVGAVNKDGVLASFSSRGPTYDHRIKPEVSAMGALTAIQSTDSTARLGYGTSFSSPVIAGATAVLWQAFPGLSSSELMRWIIESGDRAEDPDIQYGYGIPSFRTAYHAITSVDRSLLPAELNIYPNPFTESIFIGVPAEKSGTYNINLYDMQGRLVSSGRVNAPGRTLLPSALLPGMYIIEIQNDIATLRSRIIKK